MNTLIERAYCLKHPGAVVPLFGLGVYVGMLFSSSKSLLERALESNDLHGYAIPGDVGRAYRLAALMEFRVASIYKRFAERFSDQPAAADFFRCLHEEELEHGRLMLLCRYTIRLHPRLRYLPRLQDPVIRSILSQLRSMQRRIEAITLEEAFEATIELEQGEINAVFERLLKQAEAEQTHLFASRMREVEGHAASVPKRISALRDSLRRMA